MRRSGSHGWIHGLPLKMRFKRSKIYLSVIPVIVVCLYLVVIAVIAILAALLLAAIGAGRAADSGHQMPSSGE